ncbi:protein kinase C-binding protein NELL2-like, partial [Dendronephthya gigantea]|uniref:protein kinase C-binding protein NELL2-like n=1 Tax=Dendronephthya gigantea TaxID=151771 RepID=UPI00106A238F
MNKTRKKNGTWTYYEDVLVTQDIDECSNKSSHDCDGNANCNNTPGSYQCLCINGYSGDGRTCTDVNECSEGAHTCDENANCTNTDGSFNCNCQIGYTGDGNACMGKYQLNQPNLIEQHQ